MTPKPVKISTSKCFRDGLMGGVIISLAAAASVALSLGLTPPLGILCQGLIFPLGLLLVNLGQFNLFSADVFNLAMADRISGKRYFFLLTVVWVANLIGCALMALVINFSVPAVEFTQIAVTKMNAGWFALFIKAIMCNFLVCLATYLSKHYRWGGGRGLALYIPIFLFITLGFEHIVADMFYFIIGGMQNVSFSFATILLDGLLPVTLGNFFGGWINVFLAYSKSPPQTN